MIKIRIFKSPRVPCGVALEPVSQRVSRRYRAHLAEMGQAIPEEDSLVALFGDEADEFVAGLPDRARRDLKAGWDVVILMDPWEWGHLVGYDAHNV